ncbi:MAG: bifunctional DNA-formamidopyrimidine glycosylase/DNA-(apurinic or apyrimidinic site) lyase [Chloroflexi bacterium]|nr:bifunctional DNA-formamidopyrimidine glycosylase/DNA-(apurinic or apyrimidinic site) lyase [Chloroflexota bacterium]
MPELPEVETIRRDLQKRILGRSITGFQLLRPQVVKEPDEAMFRIRIIGRFIMKVDRRGKYIVIRFMGGDALIVHLMMTGQLLVQPIGTEPSPYTHLVLEIDGKWEVHFDDVRRFGRVWLTRRPQDVLGKLGPEPLEGDFTPDGLATALAERASPIKPVLLAQEVVAGIGNIYADEALWLAGVRAERPANTLSIAEVDRLHQAIKDVMTTAIEHRGTTFANFRDSYGMPGGNQEHLQVFRRTGEPCPRCGAPIQKVSFRGRGTHFCPDCQK